MPAWGVGFRLRSLPAHGCRVPGKGAPGGGGSPRALPEDARSATGSLLWAHPQRPEVAPLSSGAGVRGGSSGAHLCSRSPCPPHHSPALTEHPLGAVPAR